ncbi:MAG: succinyl-diaminopimelate desuccinylase [Pseudomonadota bacterium]
MTDPLSPLPPEAEILRDLIRCPSVTPEEGGALAYLEKRLSDLGFVVTRKVFSADGTADVENLYARWGTQSPNLCFAGHTDVVPTGDEAQWSAGPFSGDIRDGVMYGRGAVDMKGGIACYLAAVEGLLESGWTPRGSLSFLITGDEEGPAINGTTAILDWLVDQGEVFSACVVGEPTNPATIGDAVKIGRRGSVSGILTVRGTQGHAAYPHLADNPVRGLLQLTSTLLDRPFDQGTADFQPTNLEVTSVDVGNLAFNIIPEHASARFNVRFNDTWTADTIKQEIGNRLAGASTATTLRHEAVSPVRYEVIYTDRPSHVFLTRDDTLISSMRAAVQSETGRVPNLSTDGGTSDARFIKEVCPVIEFGLVGKTMHQVDERTALSDLTTLTAIYRRFIEHYFEVGLSGSGSQTNIPTGMADS